MTNLQKRILTSIIILPVSFFFILKGGYFLVFTDKNYDLKQEEDLNKITFKIACDWYGASATEL